MSVDHATRSTVPSAAVGHAAVPVTTGVVIVAAFRALWSLAERSFAWNDRRRQRQALLALDDHLLKDIGVSRYDAEREAHKPFWRE